ncbi:MAG: hypothetical protein GVY16_09105 [Planctomycetes bacterium]|jgi:Spy/CpxP family protein refolding chaperone|nr:hypothetical protein [Phycisphaerae bacterium]NBB95880.1 hypothetical protein [Planctomycetota bacterium]
MIRKTIACLIVAAATIATIAPAAIGEDEGAGDCNKPAGRGRQKGRPGRRGTGRQGPLSKLDLTEQQETTIKAIMDYARAQARKTDEKDLKRSLHRDAMEHIIETVLTPEQKEKLQAARPRGRRRGNRPKVNLTEQQQAQRKEIMQAAIEKAKNAEGREKGRIMRQARRQVFETVLTDEQRATIQQARRENSPLGKVGATDEQFARIEAIIKEAREQAQTAESRQQRRDIMIAARKRIAEDVLTDEQRETMKEMRKQWRQRMKEHRQRRRERRKQRRGPAEGNGEGRPPEPLDEA